MFSVPQYCEKTGENNEIRCPCVKCGNTYLGSREMVETHLRVYGMMENYTFWYHHEEKFGELNLKPMMIWKMIMIMRIGCKNY